MKNVAKQTNSRKKKLYTTLCMLVLVKFCRTKTYSSIRMENRMKTYFLTAKHFIAENSVEFNAIKENVFSSVAFDWCHKIKSLIIYKFDDLKCRGFFFTIFFLFSFVSNILQTFSWCLSQRLYFKRSTLFCRGECENQSLNSLWTHHTPALSILLYRFGLNHFGRVTPLINKSCTWYSTIRLSDNKGQSFALHTSFNHMAQRISESQTSSSK